MPDQKRTLAEIAHAIDAKVLGDGAVAVERLAAAGAAPGPQDLVIAFAPEAAAQLKDSGARLALIAEGVPPPPSLVGVLVAERPRLAFARLLQMFETPPLAPAGVHPSAVVDPSARLGEGVSIGPLVVIGPGAVIGAGSRLLAQVTIGRDAVLGEGCLLHPGVRIGERVRVGRGVIIQANAVVGSDGFSYVTPHASTVELAAFHDSVVRTRNEPVERLPSLGTVIIEDGVEIGANTTVDRATLAITRIGARTKIDNLVQVAHNCRIGQDCLIAAQVGLAGSVTLGDRVVLGGQVGIADHHTIGDDAVVVGSGVANDIPPAEIHVGSPTLRKDQRVEEFMSLRRLPRMLRDLLDLRRRVSSLEKAAQEAGSERARHD